MSGVDMRCKFVICSLAYNAHLDSHGALGTRVNRDEALQLLHSVITKGLSAQAMC